MTAPTFATLKKRRESDSSSKPRISQTNDEEQMKKEATHDGFADDPVSGSSLDAGVSNATQSSSYDTPQELQTLVLFKKSSCDNQNVMFLSHYELRLISSQKANQNDSGAYGNTAGNDEEYGLFATQRIKEGTRIISEAPLLTLPFPGNDINQIRAAYDELCEKDQMRVWSLRASPQEASEQLLAYGTTIQPVLASTITIMGKSKDERTEEEQSELNETGPKLEWALETSRLACRFSHNQHSLIDLPGHQRDNLPPEKPITGLFAETAKLRHSCVPNCYVAYSPATNRMTVHVTRDIQLGEELTASSIADTMYYDTADVRKQKLFDQFGINCACEACDSSHPNFSIHEKARLQAYGRAVMLADFCTRLEMTDLDPVEKDLYFPNPPREFPTQKELEDAEEMVLALCENLRATKCVTIEHIRWRNALIDRIQPKIAESQMYAARMKTWKAMATHAKICEVVGVRCYGEDHEEFKKLTARKEKIFAALQQAQDDAKPPGKSSKST